MPKQRSESDDEDQRSDRQEHRDKSDMGRRKERDSGRHNRHRESSAERGGDRRWKDGDEKEQKRRRDNGKNRDDQESRGRRDDDKSRDSRESRGHRDDGRNRGDRESRGHRDDRDRNDRESRGHRDDDRSRDDWESKRHRDANRNRDNWESRRHRDDDRSRDDRESRPYRDDDRSRNNWESRRNRDNDRSRDHWERRKRKLDDDGQVDAGDRSDHQVADKEDEDYLKNKRAKTGGDDMLNTRTGGAYIPPAKLRMMQAQISDKSSMQFQRLAWEALKKSLNGLINKVNVSNIVHIVRELFQENIVRGRGLLTRSIIQAQAASPTFTHVYAALVAIINTKFPQIGELLLKRVVLQFRKGFKRNNKDTCLSSVRFVAHLVNQQVAHEIIALEILTLLLDSPTDDSVEVAVGFLKECGQKLTEVSPRGMHAIFESLRTVLHDGQIDKRTQYMVEVMYAVRKDGFKDHPSVIDELDLVDEQDQFTHMLTLDDVVGGEEMLNVFKLDPEYEQTEEKYKVLKKDILEDDSDDDESGSGGSGSSSDDEDSSDEEGGESQVIIDQTETNMIALRRTIYLTIQSSLDFEECAHKLLKLELKPGQEVELCSMILDCCAQQRTYEKFFGLLAQRFCMIDKKYIEPFQAMFLEQYQTIHRLETNKLRNVGKFFAHLLHTDAMSWEVLENIRLNEEDTTSSSRIFIKILFQELSEYMGLPKLNDRLRDVTLQPHFEGLFPRDHPKNTRFAINFFTSIGLGGLTDELRAHLKTMPKTIMQQQQQVSSSSSSSSDSSSSDSDSDSSSSESSSDDGKRSWKKVSHGTRDSKQGRRSSSGKKDKDTQYASREKVARLKDSYSNDRDRKDRRKKWDSSERKEKRDEDTKKAKSKKSRRQELEERIERIDIRLERRYRRVRSQERERQVPEKKERGDSSKHKREKKKKRDKSADYDYKDRSFENEDRKQRKKERSPGRSSKSRKRKRQDQSDEENTYDRRPVR